VHGCDAVPTLPLSWLGSVWGSGGYGHKSNPKLLESSQSSPQGEQRTSQCDGRRRNQELRSWPTMAGKPQFHRRPLSQAMKML